MGTGRGHNIVARLALLLLATFLVAAGPSEPVEKLPCEQLPACRTQKAAGLESQARGQLDVALGRLRAAYALSHDYRLQAPLGRVLQQLGRGDEAFDAYQQFLQAAPYNHPQRAGVEKWLRELLESLPPEAERAPEASPSTAVLLKQPLPRCPPFKPPLARRVAGGILLGLSAAGLVASTVLAAKNGALTGEACAFDGLQSHCRWDTVPAFATGYALSTAGLVGGTLVLTLPIRSAARESGVLTCQKP